MVGVMDGSSELLVSSIGRVFPSFLIGCDHTKDVSVSPTPLQVLHDLLTHAVAGTQSRPFHGLS